MKNLWLGLALFVLAATVAPARAASVDTTNAVNLMRCADSTQFQERVYLRFINAAVAVTNEAGTVTSHTQRVAFAGAIFNNTPSRQVLAMVALANSTNAANCLADTTNAGGNILDSDLDFTINADFTGIATSRGW